MADLAISETAAYTGGYRFRRSDGRRFFVRFNQDGSASVFTGVPDGPPQEAIADLAISVVDKVERAKFLILTYRG